MRTPRVGMDGQKQDMTLAKSLRSIREILYKWIARLVHPQHEVKKLLLFFVFICMW